MSEKSSEDSTLIGGASDAGSHPHSPPASSSKSLDDLRTKSAENSLNESGVPVEVSRPSSSLGVPTGAGYLGQEENTIHEGDHVEMVFHYPEGYPAQEEEEEESAIQEGPLARQRFPTQEIHSKREDSLTHEHPAQTRSALETESSIQTDAPTQPEHGYLAETEPPVQEYAPRQETSRTEDSHPYSQAHILQDPTTQTPKPKSQLLAESEFFRLRHKGKSTQQNVLEGLRSQYDSPFEESYGFLPCYECRHFCSRDEFSATAAAFLKTFFEDARVNKVGKKVDGRKLKICRRCAAERGWVWFAGAL